MKLDDATWIAMDLVSRFKPMCEKIEIAGGIRRNRAEVHDIDLVAIPKLEGISPLYGHTIDQEIEHIAENIILSGPVIKRFIYKQLQCELWLADEKERMFSCLLMIRTGSKEFNMQMATRAINLGMKLHASGAGLFKVMKDGNHKIIKEDLVANTEEDIIKTLFGRSVKPEERDGFVPNVEDLKKPLPETPFAARCKTCDLDFTERALFHLHMEKVHHR